VVTETRGASAGIIVTVTDAWATRVASDKVTVNTYSASAADDDNAATASDGWSVAFGKSKSAAQSRLYTGRI